MAECFYSGLKTRIVSFVSFLYDTLSGIETAMDPKAPFLWVGEVNPYQPTYYGIEGTVFFVFNSFGQETMAKVLANIRHSLKLRPRQVWFIDWGVVYEGLLAREGWLAPEALFMHKQCRIWRSI